MAYLETAEIIKTPQLDTFVTAGGGDKPLSPAKLDTPHAALVALTRPKQL